MTFLVSLLDVKPHLFIAPGENANSGVRFLIHSKHEDAISSLESSHNHIPLFVSLLRSSEPHFGFRCIIRDTKMSQNGCHVITHIK